MQKLAYDVLTIKDPQHQKIFFKPATTPQHDKVHCVTANQPVALPAGLSSALSFFVLVLLVLVLVQ